MEAAVLLDARQYAFLNICGLCRHHLRVRLLQQCEHSLGLSESAEGMSMSVPDQADQVQPARDSSLETASLGRDASEEPQSHAPACKAAHPRAPALLPENKRKDFQGQGWHCAAQGMMCKLLFVLYVRLNH